ncbi:MAG: hypothetical protein KDE03_17625 [Rhodobacteraceae bacterium]|nr:hypothetical protein [Paracoccaceae bacterium]
MPTKYLKTLRLDYDANGVLEVPCGLPEEPGARQKQLDLSWRLSRVIDRLKISWVVFEYALRAAKIEMKDPRTTTVWLTLSRFPNPDLISSKGNLNIDRPYDPLKLLDIPLTAEAYGEFVLECWDWAIERLENETDFPADFIREQMAKFRAQGYAMGNTLKQVSIVGSKAKARIHGEISCVRTVLKVEVSYRGEILFERVIWDVPDQAFNTAYEQRKVIVENGQFKVLGARWFRDHFMLPEAAFPLDSLPEAFRKTLTS